MHVEVVRSGEQVAVAFAFAETWSGIHFGDSPTKKERYLLRRLRVACSQALSCDLSHQQSLTNAARLILGSEPRRLAGVCLEVTFNHVAIIG